MWQRRSEIDVRILRLRLNGRDERVRVRWKNDAYRRIVRRWLFKLDESKDGRGDTPLIPTCGALGGARGICGKSIRGAMPPPPLAPDDGAPP